MGYRLKFFRVDESKYIAIADGPKYAQLAKNRGEVLMRYSIAVFMDRKRDVPWRPSETSPPKYAESFELRKLGRIWRLVNKDPGAIWVEFGAHAGGVTSVLKYKPMRTALDMLEAEGRLGG